MDKVFSINHPVLFILAGICVLIVVLQSAVFLAKAWKRALELGYEKTRLKKLVINAVIFTIAPAIAVGIGIITLAGTLGLPLPWLRLSVVGSIVYELSAAETAAKSMGAELGSALTATEFSTIAWTMTVGITPGVVMIPLLCKKYTGAFANVGKKDRAWGDQFVNAIFMGLIATLVAQSLAGIRLSTAGRLSSAVLLVSALVMVICGILKKKLKWDWLNDYALPICMIVSMAAAIPLAAIIK